MIVEPGFFRTELLTPESTTFGELSIDDYDEARAEINAFWASMNGTQAGDPAKLARALVQLADSDRAAAALGGRRGRGRGRRGQGAAAARAGRRAPRAVDQPGPRGREGGRLMRGAVMHGPGEVRVEEREAPQIVEPTDAIIRVSAACVCGSDLWPYRGIGVEDSMWPMPMGHEYAGIVEEVGDAVTTVKPGQFVVGSFWATDNTCAICRAGYQSACVNRVPMGALGAQADLLRVPLADGTLIATPDIPSDDLVPSLLSASDVLGTGWFGAVAAEAGPGKTVAVVGDGAVGLLAVLAAKQLGAERIIAMSRHESPPAPGARVRRDRHRRGARRRGRRRDQGAHRRARRALGGRGGRHAGVDEPGAARHAARRPRRASSASRTASRWTAWTCSGASRTSTAAPPRCAASCPS